MANATTGAPLCVRTEVLEVGVLRPPLLTLVTPVQPPMLRLATGDDGPSFTASFTVGRDTADGRGDPPPAVRVVPVIRRTDNTICRGVEVLLGGRGASTAVIALLVGGRVDVADDGAVAYFEIRRAHCAAGSPSSIGTDHTTLGGGTTPSVSAANPSLVAQDVKTPTVGSVIYPPTAEGRPVQVEVNATHGGGGRWRGAGCDGVQVATALSYQWYKQGRGMIRYPLATPLNLLRGKTASTLNITAKCLDPLNSCGTFGCSGLEQYVVDVCNTHGCARSNIIKPAILRTPGVAAGKDEGQYMRCIYVS